MTDQELIAALAPKLGMEPEELEGELFQILLTLGAGLIWSDDFYYKIWRLSRDIKLEIGAKPKR